jgi:hypothetical protein
MGPTNVELLYLEWQWLVRESASAVRAARGNGMAQAEIQAEEQRYALRIDAVYTRLKQAEARTAGASAG